MFFSVFSRDTWQLKLAYQAPGHQHSTPGTIQILVHFLMTFRASKCGKSLWELGGARKKIVMLAGSSLSLQGGGERELYGAWK